MSVGRSLNSPSQSSSVTADDQIAASAAPIPALGSRSPGSILSDPPLVRRRASTIVAVSAPSPEVHSASNIDLDTKSFPDGRSYDTTIGMLPAIVPRLTSQHVMMGNMSISRS